MQDFNRISNLPVIQGAQWWPTNSRQWKGLLEGGLTAVYVPGSLRASFVVEPSMVEIRTSAFRAVRRQFWILSGDLTGESYVL